MLVNDSFIPKLDLVGAAILRQKGVIGLQFFVRVYCLILVLQVFFHNVGEIVKGK